MPAPASFDIVVSAENNHYHAWQCMLFHYSCLTVLDRTPIIVVHSDPGPLVTGFELIATRGGVVQRRKNFRHAGEIMYAPRNQMRTANLVATDAEHIVLCDPDMIFLEPIDFAAIIDGLPRDAITMDRISFLKVNDRNRPFIGEVCAESGISLARVESKPMNGAPPHVIPKRLRLRLCQQWHVQLERYLAASHAHHGGSHSDVWISSMWGLVLAMHALGIEAVLTDLSMHTHGDPPVASVPPRPLLHYSYDTPAFNKRDYVTDNEWMNVWRAEGSAGRASGIIGDQLALAAEFFGLD